MRGMNRMSSLVMLAAMAGVGLAHPVASPANYAPPGPRPIPQPKAPAPSPAELARIHAAEAKRARKAAKRR